MNILLFGAFGHLGQALLKELDAKGHNIKAVGRTVRGDWTGSKRIETVQCDIMDKKCIKGICQDMDMVISTVGLTKASKEVTHYDVDYKGNLELLKEAIRSGVKKFIYISVIKCDEREDIPMLHAKYLFEKELEKSGMEYTIYRPTGYFYDIAKVFKPMIEKGEVKLFKNSKVSGNVVSVKDFSQYIVENLTSKRNEVIEVGGRETYTYEEIATMFFKAAGKPINISYVSPKVFDIIALVSKIKKNGNYANIKFGQWTLSNEMVASNCIGKDSFKEYIFRVVDER